MPGAAVKTRPTLSVPLIVGVGEATKAPALTGAVGALVAATLRYPSRTAVTRSVIGWPSWAGPGEKVGVVAPARGTPEASHW